MARGSRVVVPPPSRNRMAALMFSARAKGQIVKISAASAPYNVASIIGRAKTVSVIGKGSITDKMGSMAMVPIPKIRPINIPIEDNAVTVKSRFEKPWRYPHQYCAVSRSRWFCVQICARPRIRQSPPTPIPLVPQGSKTTPIGQRTLRCLVMPHVHHASVGRLRPDRSRLWQGVSKRTTGQRHSVFCAKQCAEARRPEFSKSLVITIVRGPGQTVTRAIWDIVMTSANWNVQFPV